MDAEKSAIKFITKVQTEARTGEWMIIVPVYFPEPMSTEAGMARAMVAVLGFYPHRESAVEVAEKLAIDYPGQTFQVERSTAWVPICSQYNQVDVILTDKPGSATEFAKAHARKSRQAIEQEKILARERERQKDKTSIEYYTKLRFLAYQQATRLAELTSQLVDYEHNHPELVEQFPEHIARRFANTDEAEIAAQVLQHRN